MNNTNSINPCVIVYINDFVKYSVKTNDKFLSINNGNIICNKEPWIVQFIDLLCEEYYNIIDTLESYPMEIYSPYVILFINAVKRYILHKEIERINDGNYKSTSSLSYKYNIFNRFIDRLRIEGDEVDFKIAEINYNKTLRKNYNSLVNYIDNLFAQCARLLVLRVDFGYTKNDFPIRYQDEVNQEHQQAIKDREHFFNNFRSNKLFNYLVGSAWKLEFSTCKGFHYHMLFFFDGSKVREDVTIAKLIGEYWQQVITPDRGLYFNCNAKKREYQFLGIGMINHFDTALRENLNAEVARYLVKPDLYAKLDSSGYRSFGRKVMSTKTTNLGRPRNSIINSLQGLTT